MLERSQLKTRWGMLPLDVEMCFRGKSSSSEVLSFMLERSQLETR